jgi:hypothetical protein
MKKLSSCCAILFCLIVLTQSCKKDSTAFISEKDNSIVLPGEVNVKIASDETYQFDLGVFGPEETAGISRQAAYYEISAITRDYSGRITYKYKPTIKYVGPDEVELKSSKSSGGTCSKDDVKTTIIKFTITN